MNTPLRIGVIGVGAVYRRFYRPALGRSPQFTLIAAADPAAKDFTAAPLYPSAEAMLEAHALDGVIVLSPPGLHAEHVALATSRGLRVLVEKPPALAVAEIDSWPHPELVTPAFAKRYLPRYRRGFGSGRQWRFRFETDPVSWGALQPEPVERDLLAHAADLATWLSGEAIREVTEVERQPKRARGVFVLSEGGRFEWEVAHGDSYIERLELDGRELATGAPTILERVQRRLRRRPGGDVAAICLLLADWVDAIGGASPSMLPTVADARSCAAVIEAVERVSLREP